MKKLFTLISIALFSTLSAQQVYCDFDGTKVASLAEWNGVMDSTAANPAMTSTVNPSALCGKYIRDTAKYDNFKFFPYSTLSDVTPWCNTAAASKITMKLYTSAPIGTKVDLQLGVKSNTTYPAGVYAEFTTTTSVQNAWEILSFNYINTVAGTTIAPTSIDKIVILFRPNSNVKDTIYFDEPTGPQLVPIGISENKKQNSAHLYQNSPNPAKESTEIKFELEKPGKVSLKIYDMLGKEISTVIDSDLPEGIYKRDISTSGLTSGVYFYTLKQGNSSRTMKMIVSK